MIIEENQYMEIWTIFQDVNIIILDGDDKK